MHEISSMEKFLFLILRNSLPFLIGCIFLFMAFRKKINSFVKGLIIAAITIDFLTIFMRTFVFEYPKKIKYLTKTFAFPNKMYFVIFVGWMFSFFLISMALILMIDSSTKYSSKLEKANLTKSDQRNVALSFLLFVITGGIYSLVWFYQTIKKMTSNFPAVVMPYKPGYAVGLMFVPILNTFWTIYIYFTITQKVKEVEEKYCRRNVGFHFHPGIITTLFIALTVIVSISYKIPLYRYSSKLPYDYRHVIPAIWLTSFLAYGVLLVTIQSKLNAILDECGKIIKISEDIGSK
jgi:large-conductance mechanosensitive channel